MREGSRCTCLTIESLSVGLLRKGVKVNNVEQRTVLMLYISELKLRYYSIVLTGLKVNFQGFPFVT